MAAVDHAAVSQDEAVESGSANSEADEVESPRLHPAEDHVVDCRPDDSRASSVESGTVVEAWASEEDMGAAVDSTSSVRKEHSGDT